MPPNMPKFDMNASVIRLGTNGPPKPSQHDEPRGPRNSNAEPLGNPRRAGLGLHSSDRGDRGGGGGGNIEQQRAQIRESMQALLPPKSDEVLKTIFVGNITEGCRGDAGVEELLRTVGGLRKWTRAFDADGKACTFGFAEYEDSESLDTAARVLVDVQVPVKRQVHRAVKEEVKTEEGEEDKEESKIEKVKLLVSLAYTPFNLKLY
jgi:hypothetical protein